jgi:hypothetical protein
MQTLWLTDRTRYSTGTGRCAQERYLTNHFGPTGYGIVPRSDSLPLATGIYVHKALETLFQHLAETDTFPPLSLIRSAIQKASDDYEAKIEGSGYRGLLASESSSRIVQEQKLLLAGLIYALCRQLLPWLWRNYRVLEAETESIVVLDCTCGLGSTTVESLNAAEHASRDCLGIGQMLRQDVIAEHRETKRLAYFEAKTTGQAGESWAPAWETKPQLGIGTFGIEARYGKSVSEFYIIGLYKGRRQKVEDPFEGTWYRQDSPFCYGFCRPGNPPLAPDDWLPAYEWVNADGETKRAGRTYQKRSIADLINSDWPTWLERADQAMTPGEFWINFLPPSVVEKQVFLVGPLIPQQAQIETLKHAIVGEERKWQDILWKLYEYQIDHPWESPEFQAKLNSLVPPSFECRRFGLRHECAFVPICFKQAGWEDPLGGGKFVPRSPHHEPELQAAIERGLLPEQAEESEEEE